LAVHAEMRELAPDPLTVGITGSSGLVGTALAALLSTGGHRVIRLVRTAPNGPDERQWNPGAPTPELLDGLDAVVHLAGAPIAGRFTHKHRTAVYDSRVGPTARLAQAAGQTPFISASAIGFYGYDRGDEQLEESAVRGAGFLADVVDDWEADARQAAGRSVSVRIGIVQSARGGAMALQRPLFAAGLGGPMAGGEQWLSWIALDDLLDVFYRAIVDDRLAGPVNAVAPHPERQRDWARTMGRVMHRPAVLPTPEFGPKLLLGEDGAREVAAASQRVVPARLQELGHRFRFAHLEAALRHELGQTTEDDITRSVS
ncbi:MAG: TIGR01777 family oxidoreductase, partial [Micrococcales bacterium]|nr:TIGR01777 family oxidoreductase [Micrococcales bacterium]